MSTSVTGRICPYPFSRMESPGSPFIPCCRSWLTEEFLAIEPGIDPWNGPAAQQLRQSILDGSYRYCRRDRCGTELLTMPELAARQANPGELPISPTNLHALLAGVTELPEGPAALTVMGDPRCNLACGSCRPAPILHETPEITEAAQRTARLLAVHGKNLRILKIAGDGEAFFSPFLRKTLASLRKVDFPKLEKVDILTNGLLFDQQALADLQPGAEFIRSLNVSLDAGDAGTYAKIRGGSWERLVANLNWMAAERARGRFDFLGLTYVLQAGNFRSLPAFLELARELAVDEVYISQLYPWERMRISFAAEAVHLPGHPLHAEFAQIWRQVEDSPRSFRWRTNLA